MPEVYGFPKGFSGGLNISLSPDLIGANQSCDMINCNYDSGGVPEKRVGFSRVNTDSWGSTPIRGIFEYNKTGENPVFIIAHGGKLWSYDESTNTKTDLGITITDADTYSFQMGNVIYFYNGTDFVFWDGLITPATVQSVAKVPTVTMGCPPAGGGTSFEDFNYLSNSWKTSFSSDGTATNYQITMPPGFVLSATPFKAWINDVLKSETTDFTVNRTTGVVTFYAAPILGTDNVVIQSEGTDLMDYTRITKCLFHIEYGGQNDSRIFMAGNPDSPNVRFHCGVYDPTYWPENNYEGIGTTPITGFGRLGDMLLTYKEHGDQTSIWYSNMVIASDNTSTFPSFPLQDEFGCIAPHSIQPAQNGLLALSNDGVIWTSSAYGVRNQANTKIASYNVNGGRFDETATIVKGILDNTALDLANAHSIIYKNKYWLHVKDKVWVLDLNYSIFSKGIFCWYPYDALPGKAAQFHVKDERLYFGDNSQGLIYSERFDDAVFQYVDDGQPIDAWWESPLLFLGGREWEKKFERLNLSFKPSHGTYHELTLTSDQGPESISLRQSAGYFDARYFHAEFLCAGTINQIFPSAQSEKIGFKGEYMSFKIRNNARNRGLTMLSSVISYVRRRRVK